MHAISSDGRWRRKWHSQKKKRAARATRCICRCNVCLVVLVDKRNTLTLIFESRIVESRKSAVLTFVFICRLGLRVANITTDLKAAFGDEDDLP
jgi:predicted metal-binding protein